jgi:hypothetical protein
MNHMRTIGSRKISGTRDSDAYAPQRTAVVRGTSTLGSEDVTLGQSRASQRRWVSRTHQIDVSAIDDA